MRNRKKAAIIGVLTILGLVGGLFAGLTLARADDLVRTDVGYREFTLAKNGNPARGELTLKVYASQFDGDGDGDTAPDSQRAVARAYKRLGVVRVQINTVRLQRYTSTGWETLRGTAPKNSGTASFVTAYTDPPTPFRCGASTIYRVQAIGLIRWADNSLSSFNKESGHWANVAPSRGACEPLNI